MSTQKLASIDRFDPASSLAPKHAHDRPAKAKSATKSQAERRHAAGIETDHDARILDEIELSLRAMISTDPGAEPPERLSDVSRFAAEEIAQQKYLEQACAREQQLKDRAGAQPRAETSHDAGSPESPKPKQFAADVASVREALHDPRTPPWLLARSLDTEPIPEPVGEHWPQRRKPRLANRVILHLGLAATGAAIVAAIAILDVPGAVIDSLRSPFTDLSSNAATVFNEGKASRLQPGAEAVQQERDRVTPEAKEAVLRKALLASADPKTHAVPVATETVARPKEVPPETVTAPWPSPETAKRSEPSGWHEAPVPPAPPQAAAPKPAGGNAASSRALDQEEIAMLRKMGDDYISSGDFVGARGVLERAAQAGDASAAFALASTYDPVVLGRFKVRGLEPDIVKASFWYERARELGSPEAPHRLRAMMASRGN